MKDQPVLDAIASEERRQKATIELIASENFASPDVLAAMGTVLNNKYAEGYPGKRYYGGCAYVDIVESLAKERAARLFGAEHVNVQPHSGAQANMAAYFAVTDPGATIRIWFSTRITPCTFARRSARARIASVGASPVIVATSPATSTSKSQPLQALSVASASQRFSIRSSS